jgi:hypothetical protein
MTNRVPREHAAPGSVYWMEASKRRQALTWLEREDLTPGERETLERFARVYRTGTELSPAERRALLVAFDRVARRLRGRVGPPSGSGRGGSAGTAT